MSIIKKFIEFNEGLEIPSTKDLSKSKKGKSKFKYSHSEGIPDPKNLYKMKKPKFKGGTIEIPKP